MDQNIKFIRSVILGTIAGVFSSVALMIIFAVVINTAFGDPDKVISAFTCVAASSGAATGGFCASRIYGTKGFLTGISTGLAISSVILLVMFFCGKSPADNNAESANIIYNLIIILCQIVFACIGGIFSINSIKSINSRNSRKNKKALRLYPVSGLKKNK